MSSSIDAPKEKIQAGKRSPDSNKENEIPKPLSKEEAAVVIQSRKFGN